MLNAVLFMASLAALVSGALLGSALFENLISQKRREATKALLGSSSVLEALSISLESTGMTRKVLARAVKNSRSDHRIPQGLMSLLVPNWSLYRKWIEKAGLEGFIDREGAAATNLQLLALGCAIGGIIGALFSVLLMLLGLVAGTLWGMTALSRALKEEGANRSFVAEKQLSQMIEIVILGLRSGMTFDRALTLFHGNFEGALSASLALAQGQWSHGLIERSEGLRAVARSYDSPLFDRLSESIIRSLRFGTSLAGNLSLLAAEARAVRKAKLEEKVAKAPVKMLLPVGGLILPAMLVLIMGPILLDLMQGS